MPSHDMPLSRWYSGQNHDRFAVALIENIAKLLRQKGEREIYQIYLDYDHETKSHTTEVNIKNELL